MNRLRAVYLSFPSYETRNPKTRLEAQGVPRLGKQRVVLQEPSVGVTGTVRVEMPTHWRLAEVTEIIFKCC